MASSTVLGEYSPSAGVTDTEADTPSVGQPGSVASSRVLGEYDPNNLPDEPTSPEQGKKFHEGLYRHAFQSIPILGAASKENLDDIAWQSDNPNTSMLTDFGVKSAAAIPATEGALAAYGGTAGKEMLSSYLANAGLNVGDTVAHGAHDSGSLLKALGTAAPALLGPILSRLAGPAGKWQPDRDPNMAPPEQPPGAATPTPASGTQHELPLDEDELHPYPGKPGSFDDLLYPQKGKMPWDKQENTMDWVKEQLEGVAHEEGIKNSQKAAAEEATAQADKADDVGSKISKMVSGNIGHVVGGAGGMALGGLGGHMLGGGPEIDALLSMIGGSAGYHSEALNDIIEPLIKKGVGKYMGSTAMDEQWKRAMLSGLINTGDNQVNQALDTSYRRDQGGGKVGR